MKKSYILFVDGYNLIGAWEKLYELQRQDRLSQARDLLLFELSNYAQYRDYRVIVVFDAHLVPGVTSTFDYANVQVVFTAKEETADIYIEREVSQYMGPLNRVTVATSDATEQWLIFQRGALRQSAQELLIDIQLVKEQVRQDIRRHYHHVTRRKSPWQQEQMEQLARLRYELSQ